MRAAMDERGYGNLTAFLILVVGLIPTHSSNFSTLDCKKSSGTLLSRQ